jgi:transposase
MNTTIKCTIRLYRQSNRISRSYSIDPVDPTGITTGFIEKEGITLMDWLACSPDLNPIENVWSCLKRAINNYDELPQTREEILVVIREEWGRIKVSDFSGMISEMPKRMEACIAAKGGHTKR